MNFFERRAILKNANLLELTPITLHKSEISDDGMVNILVPKFKNQLAVKFIVPKLKAPDIKIKLDEFGSETWRNMDGKKNVSLIGDKLVEKFGDRINPVYERLSKFLTMLYEQRMITYREINK
jgi:hypothetical protein